jgi:hypothetical protein
MAYWLPSPESRIAKRPFPRDTETYNWLRLVENRIRRPKQWRRIPTRYDKTDASFCAFIHLPTALRAIA